eukprot:gene5871-7490_t
MSAIPYIKQAMQANQTSDLFHNSLGECYRVLGRLAEAKFQFETALELNPDNPSALFNLGLTLQATKNWEAAIEKYRHIER